MSANLAPASPIGPGAGAPSAGMNTALSPQHSIDPSACKPQECANPAEMAVNEPPGESDCPSELYPQHATVPSSRKPHECSPPAETAEYEPLGAVVCPR